MIYELQFGLLPTGRVAELPGVGAGAPTFQRPGGMWRSQPWLRVGTWVKTCENVGKCWKQDLGSQAPPLPNAGLEAAAFAEVAETSRS